MWIIRAKWVLEKLMSLNSSCVIVLTFLKLKLHPFLDISFRVGSSIFSIYQHYFRSATRADFFKVRFAPFFGHFVFIYSADFFKARFAPFFGHFVFIVLTFLKPDLHPFLDISFWFIVLTFLKAISQVAEIKASLGLLTTQAQ